MSLNNDCMPYFGTAKDTEANGCPCAIIVHRFHSSPLMNAYEVSCRIRADESWPYLKRIHPKRHDAPQIGSPL